MNRSAYLMRSIRNFRKMEEEKRKEDEERFRREEAERERIKKERSEHAFALYDELARNKEAQQYIETRNAQILDEIMKDKLYRIVLGDDTANFRAFLADPRIMYTSSVAHKLIRVHRKMRKLGIDAKEWSKVSTHRIVDALSFLTPENYQEWFAAAQTLLTRDWNIELRKCRGTITEDDEHEHENVTYEICNICGRKHKL